MSERGGWTRAQLEILGIEWPPESGWPRRVIGTELDDIDAEAFLSLRGVAGRDRRKPRKPKVHHTAQFTPKKKRTVPSLTATIHTDGCCLWSKVTCKGGCAATIVTGDGIRREVVYGYRDTTNNRMEVLAAIYGLRELKEPHNITLWSDSRYLVDSIQCGWAVSWQRKGWWEKPGIRRKNYDLFEQLLELCQFHYVTMKWVKGHNGNKENEICDNLSGTLAKNGPWLIDGFYERVKAERKEVPVQTGFTHRLK